MIPKRAAHSQWIAPAMRPSQIGTNSALTRKAQRTYTRRIPVRTLACAKNVQLNAARSGWVQYCTALTVESLSGSKSNNTPECPAFGANFQAVSDFEQF